MGEIIVGRPEQDLEYLHKQFVFSLGRIEMGLVDVSR